jgi:hypothetical protein
VPDLNTSNHPPDHKKRPQEEVRKLATECVAQLRGGVAAVLQGASTHLSTLWWVKNISHD